MAAPATVDELLDLVRKSGVVDEKRLDTYVQKMRSQLPSDVSKAGEALVRDGVITKFQAENILAGKWRRFTIGKYKVLERLGAGGMGQVYLCEHKLMRRRVAVKVLPTAKAKDSSALDRFGREARAVAALTHPNIVHAYDFDQDGDLHFLVTEFVDGANLQEIVKRSGRLDVLRACHYIRHAALALQYAHEAGLVHRDIKPGNILVDRRGVVKILDLGLARFFNDEEDLLTQKYDESVLGTADYMSPEQALDSHTADIRTDIYSLGATFYFLLTGRPPFESANVAQKLMMHQFKTPQPIEDFRQDVPADVIAIVRKMMAKELGERYAVPGDVADALEPFTQEAIPPPTDEEMPHLCAAATGNIPVLDGTETTITKNEGLASPTRVVSGSPTSAGRSSFDSVSCAPPRPQPAGSASRAPSAPAAAAAAVKSAPPPGPVAPWEAMADDTDPTPAARADTTPESSRHGARSKKKLSRAGGPRSLMVLIVSGVVGATVLLVLLIATVIWIFFPAHPAPAPQPAGPPKLEVSKDRPSAYRSVQLALRNAKIGSIIELWDENHEENVVIDPTRCPTSVTLQAAPGKEIVWRSDKKNKNNPDMPLIKIDRAGDFKLRGKGITLDGTLDKGAVKDLMLITFDCTGMVVEDLRFKKFTRTAIVLMNATGSLDHPIRLARLSTVADKFEKPRAAIFFGAEPKTLPAKNDHVHIEECDFRGFDAKLHAVKIRDEKVIGRDVNWPGR